MRDFWHDLKLLGQRLTGNASEAVDITLPLRKTFVLDKDKSRLTIDERAINSWLRREFVRHRFIRYISVELEANNQVKFQIISRYYITVVIEAQITDVWHDYSTSSVQLTWNNVRFLRMPLLPNFITEKLTYYLLSLSGFLFNPLALRPGLNLRLDGDSLRIECHEYWQQCRFREIYTFFHEPDGRLRGCDFFVVAAVTSKGLISFDLHLLSEQAQATIQAQPVRKESARYRQQLYRLQGADAVALSSIALGVSAIVMLLRNYLYMDELVFSFSRYFLLTLSIVIVSLMILNIPRWLYQFFTGKAVNKLQSASENITYRMERYNRDIELEMRALVRSYGNGSPVDGEGRQAIERLLLKAGRQRFLALRMECMMESIKRWRRLKYILAYAVTIISEILAVSWL